MQDYDEPLYLISIVAKILSIHPQTLRQYEREGLVEPGRTGGKMRLYSKRDVDRIKMILRLTRDLGVNLAGVDIIFQLKDRIEEHDALSSEQRPCVLARRHRARLRQARSVLRCGRYRRHIWRNRGFVRDDEGGRGNDDLVPRVQKPHHRHEQSLGCARCDDDIVRLHLV